MRDELDESAEPMDTRDAEALGHYCRETDQGIMAELSERYGGLVPPERLEAALRQNTAFEPREAFDRAYQAAGGLPEERALGFSTGAGAPAHVALDHLEMPITVAHERLHQLSDPALREELGAHWDEGITEDLALERLGIDRAVNACYAEGLDEARQLRSLCGEDAIERAYFQGDLEPLRACVREQLGAENLNALRRNLDTPHA